MEKKKLKLSIVGSSKKAFSSIEQAKSKSKNTVVIEKKTRSLQVSLCFQDKIIVILDQVITLSQNQIIIIDHLHNFHQILKKEN